MANDFLLFLSDIQMEVKKTLIFEYPMAFILDLNIRNSIIAAFEGSTECVWR
jgi:hypothetical protein